MCTISASFLARENVSGPAHIPGNLAEPPIDYISDISGLAQVGDDEVVRFGLAELGIFEIDPTDRIILRLEPVHKMISDEPAGTADKSRLHAITRPFRYNMLSPSITHAGAQP
jgi:hypothetical protein